MFVPLTFKWKNVSFFFPACECLYVCFSLNVHLISIYIYNSLFFLFLFYNVNVKDVCLFFNEAELFSLHQITKEIKYMDMM